VDVEGKLGKLAIDRHYNTKFKKFLYYCWVQSFIIHRYNLGCHKRNRFHLTLRNHNLLYTPTTYTTTTYHNLVWEEFETFYVLITFSRQLKSYAFGTYPDLSYFLKSWAKYIKFNFIPLIKLDKTPPICWRLGLGRSKSWWSTCLIGGELDYRTNQAKTKIMFHHLLNNNWQKNKEKLIDVVFWSLEANGLVNNWRRPWM
jgi:hypothetical protein